jgi:hypothetical protein
MERAKRLGEKCRFGKEAPGGGQSRSHFAVVTAPGAVPFWFPDSTEELMGGI